MITGGDDHGPCRRPVESCEGRAWGREMTLKGSEAVWLFCALQRDRVGSKNGRQRRMGAVRGVLEERKAAKGKCLVGCQCVTRGNGDAKRAAEGRAGGCAKRMKRCSARMPEGAARGECGTEKQP